MAVRSSSQASDISRSSSFIEQAHYQANAHWPTSTNQAARAYMAAVVRYMNNGGPSLFPKKSPLSFPLEWTVSLMNGGGPSGSPDVLWQLSLPSSYLTWTPTQWQFAFDVLEDQEIRSGFATSNFGMSSAVEYGTVATQLTEIHALIDPANTDLLWIQYDRWLPNQTPDQAFTDYQVEDVTTHVPLSVTAATVNGGQLELTVTIPSGATVVSGNTIQVTTTTSVVTTSTAEPSVTHVQGVFN
jgi:hypothetical protein